MTEDVDLSLRVYNPELIALSAAAEMPHRLDDPAKITAKAISPVCGSEVTVDLVVHDGKVVDFGYEAESCALAKTVIAVMRGAIIGKAREEIAKAGEELRAMLEDKADPPTGDWAALKILLPVRDYTARHNSILLPFEAVDKAFKSYI